MAYVLLETSVPRHLKFLAAGPEASWLWVCGLSYCQDGLTDGFIPDSAIEYLGVKRARMLARLLVSARLWETAPGGWQMHDYLDHNKAAEEVRQIRKRRREGGKLGGRPKKEPSITPTENLEGLHGVGESENLPENPVRTVPVRDVPDVPVRDGSDTHARPSRGMGSGVMAGALPKDHLRHAFCGRKCVPDFLHGEFVQSIGGADPDAAVRRFYAEVMERIPDDQPIGDEPLKFWRTQFTARFGSALPSGKTAGNAAAAARFIARGQS